MPGHPVSSPAGDASAAPDETTGFRVAPPFSSLLRHEKAPVTLATAALVFIVLGALWAKGNNSGQAKAAARTSVIAVFPFPVRGGGEQLAWRLGDVNDAEYLYRALVTAYPDDIEAWYQLGEVLFHHNTARGRSFTESRQAFERVLVFNPSDREALSIWRGSPHAKAGSRN